MKRSKVYWVSNFPSLRMLVKVNLFRTKKNIMIRKYTQVTCTGVIRTMYTAVVGNTTYHTDSIDKLNYFINNHAEVRENTF